MFLLGSTFIANNTTNTAVNASNDLAHQAVATQDIMILLFLMGGIFMGIPLVVGVLSLLRRKFGGF